MMTPLPNLRSADSFAVQLRVNVSPSEWLGGKGRALARLVTAGYPVPETGVVTTEAYSSVVHESAIQALIDRIVAGDDVSVERIDEAFLCADLDHQVADDIVSLARLVGDGGPIAVRSSATVEDMHGSSFAGQYRSLLNIDSGDSDAVLRAVRAVWASLWHPAPSAYRRAFGISQSDASMAVVLMKMIPATTAGVVFTLDPGGSGGARVEAVDGLGESLVSGQRTPSAWVVATDGTCEGSDRPLPAVPARALDLARDVAERFGVPQDVEWAAEQGDVYIVQARPITVLEDNDGFDTELDDHELTTAGIVELVPGVLPPLRWELNRLLLEEAFRSVLDSLGIIRGRSAEDRPFVRRVRGRAAIDFDQLRDAAANIPGAVAELEQQYFGQSDEPAPADAAGGLSPQRRQRWKSHLTQDLRTLQTRRKVIEQADVLVRSTEYLRERRPLLAEMPDDDLLRYIRRLVDLASRGLAAELGVAAAGAASYRRLELQLGRHLGASDGARTAQQVTTGGAFAEHQTLASASVFAGPTWSELGSSPPRLSDSARSSPAAQRQEMKDRLRALPGWTRRRVLTGGFVDVRLHLIDRLATDVAEQLKRRESAKASVLELGGEVRRAHHELGARFVLRGLLAAPEDIELLTSAEILQASDGEIPVTPDVLRRRHNWLGRYEVEGSLPVRFTGVPDREEVPLPEGDSLAGWPASPGRCRGSARVVTSANDHFVPGEVLVAEATDASWSPLFMKAAGIVVERGGPLSHAAILARELGLPAVLNVPGATRVLDGCMVSVDGDLGVVVMETEADDS